MKDRPARQNCPTPEKTGQYATSQAAQYAADRALIARGPLYPYPCACTWWHLTKSPTQFISPSAVPDPEAVDRLRELTDSAFTAFISEETKGRAAPADRIALRHPDNLKRWRDTLKDLRTSINTQLRDRAHDTSLLAHDWRKRAHGYRDALSIRLTECDDLRAQAALTERSRNEAQREQRREQQRLLEEQAATAKAARIDKRTQAVDAELDRIGIPTFQHKELRRAAGEAAIKRLIDAHGPEFSTYLAEECERIGTELPTRVRKYIGDTDHLADTA